MTTPGRVRILGLDPGTLRLGYGAIDCVGPRIAYVECGVIASPSRTARSLRLVEIGNGLAELMADLCPDVVAMEEAFYGKNVRSALALGEARGVATYVVGRLGIALSGYAPARIKQVVVGHGRADKAQVGFLVRALLSMKRTPEPDAADALAVAICHARATHRSNAQARVALQ